MNELLWEEKIYHVVLRMRITQDDTVCCFAHARYKSDYLFYEKGEQNLTISIPCWYKCRNWRKKRKGLAKINWLKSSVIYSRTCTHVMIWFHLKGILLTSSIYLYKGHLYSKEHIKKTVDSKHQSVPKTSF